MGAQSGVTREGLNYGQLGKIAFPLAPIEEQLRIVKIIEISLTNSYGLERLGKDALDKLEILEQSVLRAAFAGRLIDSHSPKATESETKETTQTQLDDFQT